MTSSSSNLKSMNDLKVKVYADGADLKSMLELAAQPMVQGLTTNPSLMRKAGVTDYKAFAKSVLASIKTKPISFEVFSDDFNEMERQAMEIASWGSNVYVKIPVTNSKGAFSGELVRTLSRKGVKCNVTAIFPLRDVARVCDALRGGAPSNVSVFAGRIADAGVDPMPIMQASVEMANTLENCEVIWASPREVFNVVQAHMIGCHIITATPDIIKKLSSIGKDIGAMSLDAVKTFREDSVAAGFQF